MVGEVVTKGADRSITEGSAITTRGPGTLHQTSTTEERTEEEAAEETVSGHVLFVGQQDISASSALKGDLHEQSNALPPGNNKAST